MTTAVLLIGPDGTKEFVRDSHVHGVRDGRLLLATGTLGAGLDAHVIREVELAEVSYAETVTETDDDLDDPRGRRMASDSDCG